MRTLMAVSFTALATILIAAGPSRLDSPKNSEPRLKHVATARPLLLRGAERGVSIRRGHPILCRPTKLCQESIPAHRHPEPLTLGQDSQDTNLSEGLQWAVTPKLTMIAGRQLSIGALPVRSSLLDFNSNTGKSASQRRVAVYGCK